MFRVSADIAAALSSSANDSTTVSTTPLRFVREDDSDPTTPLSDTVLAETSSIPFSTARILASNVITNAFNWFTRVSMEFTLLTHSSTLSSMVLKRFDGKPSLFSVSL